MTEKVDRPVPVRMGQSLRTAVNKMRGETPVAVFIRDLIIAAADREGIDVEPQQTRGKPIRKTEN